VQVCRVRGYALDQDDPDTGHDDISTAQDSSKSNIAHLQGGHLVFSIKNLKYFLYFCRELEYCPHDSEFWLNQHCLYVFSCLERVPEF
jgi:hypothetical protein